MSKNKLKNHFFAPLAIIFLSFLISLFAFAPVSFKNIALALNPADYNKATGDSLGVADWNRLDDDFVAKTGDAMQGNLNMNNNQITNLANPVNPSDAVNLSTLDSSISATIAGASFEDTSGNSLRSVCGSSAGNWQHYPIATGDGVYMDVDTSAAGFTSTPVYFTSISGIAGHWRTTGASSIYDPTSTGFRIYINDLNDEDVTPSMVNSAVPPNWGWVIHWCGFGQ